ncbi:glycosyltransferase [Sphingobium nicotianae]|uniref:Glycosyltransferase n=1 Tax=Sphingobium nicotianae TaxID=2782607 RepID=A0A9X1DCS6_9SPHN|nr:glycosyltransferase [Sphingobium nicotianae]MBT2187551.1 glycosyltransferase [Sphingobium nicotianae]
MTLRVLTLSTLFPDATRPNFGVFVERQTRELASREDIAVTVVAPVGIPPWPLSLHPRYRALAVLPAQEQWRGMDVHRPRFPILPAVGGRWHPALMTRAILPLVERLHAERPFDVIDASFFFPDGPVAQRLSARLGIPYSVKARGADIHHWGRDAATGPMVRVAAEGAAGLLAVSAAMKADMVALGMPEEAIRVHYTGVDLERFALGDRAAAKAAKGLAGPVIATLGALIPRKGQALVIEALGGLPDATLLLIGEGPDRAALIALAERLGVGSRVRFLGSVPHAELPGWLAACDVMALPSASEGLANAWVEALACGVPLVISEAGGARELVDRPEAGRIVAREAGAIREAIGALLVETLAPATVRETARRFTWAANGDALVAHLMGCVRK